MRAWTALQPATGALDVMLRVRLLPVSGSLAPMWLERPLYEAMSRCRDTDANAWCLLAEADFELWLPSIAGADPERVPSLIGHLAGWAPADQRLNSRPAGFPGTWVLGWGVSLAPGAGIGGSLRFAHPDLGFAGHRLGIEVSGDSLGGAWGQAAFTQRPSRRSLVARVGGGRARGVVWTGEDAYAYTLVSAQAAAGWASTNTAWTLSGGGSFRWDAVATAAEVDARGGTSAGPWLSLGWTGPIDARISGEVHGTSYGPWGLASLDLRDGHRFGRLELAGRALLTGSTEGPFYRLPSAGGANLVRGAPSGRWRGPVLAGVQGEVRVPIVGPVVGAVFGDVALVSGWDALAVSEIHPAAGVGVRLRLPPDGLNTTRVDLGVYPSGGGAVGWGVVVGWGEAF